jgi:hypothetical protein
MISNISMCYSIVQGSCVCRSNRLYRAELACIFLLREHGDELLNLKKICRASSKHSTKISTSRRYRNKSLNDLYGVILRGCAFFLAWMPSHFSDELDRGT